MDSEVVPEKKPYGGGYLKKDATYLREALIRVASENADGLAEALVKEGLKGNVPAIKEIHDRCVGKVVDMVNVTGQMQVVIDI